MANKIANRRATIQFTKDDLACSYGFGQSCPIFHAMKRAGIPVDGVKVGWWVGTSVVDPTSGLEGFSRGLCKAEKLLDRTMSGSPERNVLIGKKFIVKWVE